MKTLLKLFAWATLLLMLGVVVIAWAEPSNFNVTINGQPVQGTPKILVGSAGILVACLVALIAFAIAALTLAGTGLMVFLALFLCGLILLCVAVPFLLPLAIPIALLVIIFGVARKSSRPKAA